MADCKRNWRVFDCDSTNTCQIANLKAGGARATKTAQSSYWSCCDTIRTQILISSQNGELEMPGFCRKTGPFPMVRVFRVIRPVPTFRFRVEPDPEPNWQFGPVANTNHMHQLTGCISQAKWKDLPLLKTKISSDDCLVPDTCPNANSLFTSWQVWFWEPARAVHGDE